MTITGIGTFEATLRWVIPPNVTSGASTESRRKEPGDHGKSARRYGGDHRRLGRHRACNRSGFRPARCQLGLVLRPRRSIRVGALHVSAVPYALTPDLTGSSAARLGRQFLFRSGPPADASDGGLFKTVVGRAEARGGWGMPERKRARLAVAIGAALAAGASALLFSRIRGAQRLAPALRE